MSAKNSVQVLIGGKVTRLTGYESEEYLEKVASYLNHKLGELSTLNSWRRMTSDAKGTLLALNVADDCFKARKKAEELEEELQNKDKELYELKQELVDLKVRLENAEARFLNQSRAAQGGQYDRNGQRR